MPFFVPVLVAGLLSNYVQELPTATLVIEGVNVVDVRTGFITEKMRMVIDGDRIRAVVGQDGDISVPAGIQVVDGTDKYAIPGTWDMHVHAVESAWYESFLKLFVAHGITGFRDTWGDLELAARLRRERASGDRLVPRFIVAGNIVDGENAVWGGAVVAASPSDGRRVVDSLASAGAGFVKVYDGLTASVYHAIAAQASRVGIRFAGHVPSSVRATEAAEAGQWSIEHLSGVPRGCSSAEDDLISQSVARRADLGEGNSQPSRREIDEPESIVILSTQDPERCDRLMRLFVEHQTWQVPTLVALRGYALLSDSDFTNDPRIRFVPPAVRGFWTPENNPFVSERNEEDWSRQRDLLALAVELTGRANRIGVPILAGSDTPNPYAFPGSGLHDELELLVEAGLTPLEALQTATLNPARFLEATDSLGSLEVGRLADIVLLDGNPLEDIRNIRSIYAVVLGGRLLEREELDALLN